MLFVAFESLEGKTSNVAGHPFGMAMWANSSMKVFLFDGGCLGRVTGPRKEAGVVEMVVRMVGREVLTNLGVLVEVVVLVLLMIKGWPWEMVVGVTGRVL